MSKNSQLKINELRVGNFIRMISDIKDNYFKVLEVGETMKLFDCHDENGGFWYIEDFEGVKLTQKILEKCGFDKIDEMTWVNNEKSFFLCKGSGNPDGSNSGYYLSYYTTGNPLGRNMQYVHQIQNLFHSLTGQELEIKL